MGIKSSKLRDREIQKLSDKTKFSRDEIEKWHAGFMRDCPTGKLQRSEFVEIYNKFFPHGNATKFSQFVFDVFDADGSGTIDFDEFIQALAITSNSSLEDKLEWAFMLYDIDNNGSITKSEMTQIVSSVFSLVEHSENFQEENSTKPEDRVERIFAVMDTDRSGELSKEEFMEGARRDPSVVAALSLYNRDLRNGSSSSKEPPETSTSKSNVPRKVSIMTNQNAHKVISKSKAQCA